MTNRAESESSKAQLSAFIQPAQSTPPIMTRLLSIIFAVLLLAAAVFAETNGYVSEYECASLGYVTPALRCFMNAFFFV